MSAIADFVKAVREDYFHTGQMIEWAEVPFWMWLEMIGEMDSSCRFADKGHLNEDVACIVITGIPVRPSADD